jgi:hypothetical protein
VVVVWGAVAVVGGAAVEEAGAGALEEPHAVAPVTSSAIAVRVAVLRTVTSSPLGVGAA